MPASAVAIHRVMNIGAQSTTRGALNMLAREGGVLKVTDEEHRRNRKLYWRADSADGWIK